MCFSNPRRQNFWPAFFLAGLVALPGSAATISWTNIAGGLWRLSGNWSSDLLPASTNNVYITNTANKTITIDAATATENLAASTLTLRAPIGFTNMLRLVDVTTNNPLMIGTSYTNGVGGALIVTNSAIDATSATRFWIDAGTVTLESGLIDCSGTPIRVGRTGNGTLEVNSSSVLADEIYVGDAGSSGGAFMLTSSVANVASIFIVGSQANATGTVSIANAQLAVSDPVFTNKVGASGFGQMTINSGGLAAMASLSVGDGNLGKGIITINGGQLDVTDSIFKCGNAGYGQFFLNSGNVSINTSVVLGDNLGATGIVSVAGGQFSVTSPIADTSVGNSGVGQLNISGGTVSLLGSLIVAESPGSVGTVKVTGGELHVTNAITSIGRSGYGSMTISNATVTLTNVSVGRHQGGTGTLTIQNNGNLIGRDTLSIGRFTNAVGNVIVAGGLLLLTNDVIWVGREGIGTMSVSNGLVNVQSIWVAVSSVTLDTNNLPVTHTPSGTLTLAGGTTTVSSNLLVGSSLISTGQVLVCGGTLNVASPGTYLAVGSGKVTLKSGSATVDMLIATNSTGQFQFDGGTLQANNIVVSNNIPFTVGDGTNGATLLLLGGTYSFAGGLVISSNATVTGCGTISGAITNYGSMTASNCGPSMSISITAIARTNANVTVSFTTVTGANHLLEYKTNLNATNWTAILPGVIGTGGVMSRTDTSATNFSRYYRVHIP